MKKRLISLLLLATSMGFGADKQPLLSVKDEMQPLYGPLVWNGLCSAVQEGAFCYYDLKSGECVFRFPLRSNLG